MSTLLVPPALSPRIIVLGSLNIDRLWRVARLPGAGETVIALETRNDFGGKGANQAVAAGLQGARVSLVGAVGDDADGRSYRAHLADRGLDVTWLTTCAEAPTGSAHVYVDDRGENQIVVHGGANARLGTGLVREALAALLPGCAALLVQLESPLPAARAALRLAADAGVPGVLNASPFHPDFTWDIPIDTVIVNEHEMAAFFGRSAAALAGAEPAARVDFLSAHRIGNLIVTQGGEPTLHFAGGAMRTVATHPVTPRDTVGAGDTFAGAFTVRRAEGRPWEETIRRANIAAALATLALGAQAAMPARATVDAVG